MADDTPRPMRRLTEHELALAMSRLFADRRGRGQQTTRNLDSVLHQVVGETLAKAMLEKGLVVVERCAAEYARNNPEEIVEPPEGGP